MSKVEILEHLPQLSSPERAEILDRILLLEEALGPSEREQALLDEAQASYAADPLPAAPWREVEARLRARS